jgi:hypothetical protein
MRPIRNSDRLREHITAMRNQIVALQDSKLDAVINRQHSLVDLLDIQIESLTEKLKAQVDIVEVAENSEPIQKNWWQVQFKSKDRLNSILD